MIALTAEQLEAITQASKDRLNFAARLESVLTINGVDLTDETIECVYGEEEGIAVLLKATIGLRLEPREIEQTECRLEWLVERDDGSTVPILGYKGKVIEVRREGPDTFVTAATQGYEAARTPLGQTKADDREFIGFRPDTVLYDCLSVLEYDGIELPRIAEPVLYARDEPFSWTTYVSEPVAWCEEQAQLKAVDHPVNVASAYALKPSGTPVWSFEQGEDFDHGALTDETSEGERYAWVVVTRLEGAESTTEGTHTKLAEAKVDNGDRRVNPKSVLFVPYDATNASETQNVKSAYAIAFEEAERQSSLPTQNSVELGYPPFWLTRGDGVSGATREYLPTLELSSRFLWRADSVVVNAIAKTGRVAGEGRLEATAEEPITVPSFRAHGGIVPAMLGFDSAGNPYALQELPGLYEIDEGTVEFDSSVTGLSVEVTEEEVMVVG